MAGNVLNSGTSMSIDSNFFKFKQSESKTIKFYCLYPLYKEEMNYKLRKGADKLLDRFDKYNIKDVIDIHRINTCLKKGLFDIF